MLDTYWDLVQNQGRFALDGYVRFTEQSAAPGGLLVGSGHWNLYGKSGGLYYEDDNGVETGPLAAVPATIVTGTGAANRITYWTGAQTIDDVSAITASKVLFADTNGLPTFDTTLHWDNTNKNLGIGRTAVVQVLAGRRYITLEGASLSGGVEFATAQADADGNGLGIVQWSDKNSGLADKRRAAISGTLQGATANNRGGALGIFTSANNTSGLTERMRFNNDGNIYLNEVAASPGSIHPTLTTFISQFFRNSTTLGVDVQIANIATASLSSLGGISWGSRGASASDKRGAVINCSLTASGVTNPTSQLEFYLNNAGSFVQGLTLHNTGAIGVNGATFGSAGSYLRSGGAGVATVWSTLILPNAATANRIAYASASNTYGESANLAYDGTDFLLGSGTRARMSAQNRFRHLNSMASVKQSGDQTLSNATVTAINFGAEDVDTDTLHDNVTNNTRITVALTGKYLIGGTLNYATNGTGVRQLRLHLNGSGTPIRISAIGAITGDNSRPATVWLVSLTAADYIELHGYQDSGGNLDVQFGAPNSHFFAAYIGE